MIGSEKPPEFLNIKNDDWIEPLPNLIISDKPPAFMDIKEKGPQDGLVKTWSFSRLDNAEKCLYSIYLSVIEKAPRVESEAADRGSMMHDQAEQFVRGHLDPIPKSLEKHYLGKFIELRDLFEAGQVMCEDDWGYNANWEPTGWVADDIWLRMKLDALVHESDTSARVIDYKSGKPYPIKHNQQGQLYAIGAFIRYPKLQFVQTEFWYLDKTPVPATNGYTREQAMYYLPGWTQRALRLTQATKFPANPSNHNCRFCDHKKSETCEFRV